MRSRRPCRRAAPHPRHRLLDRARPASTRSTRPSGSPTAGAPRPSSAAAACPTRSCAPPGSPATRPATTPSRSPRTRCADGMIARADLAMVCLAAVAEPAARGTTFAVFAQPGAAAALMGAAVLQPSTGMRPDAPRGPARLGGHLRHRRARPSAAAPVSPPRHARRDSHPGARGRRGARAGAAPARGPPSPSAPAVCSCCWAGGRDISRGTPRSPRPSAGPWPWPAESTPCSRTSTPACISPQTTRTGSTTRWRRCCGRTTWARVDRCGCARSAPASSGPGCPPASPAAPVPADSPLLLGFHSGLRRNQATEAEITIPAGPLAGGTTMHVSRINLDLERWYELDGPRRSALMYAPTVTPRQAARFSDDAPADFERLPATARRHGVVGHAQAAARARLDGRPRINRRDFVTFDDGIPGTHFVSLQRTLEDFNATRAVMNAADGPAPSPGRRPACQQRHQRVHGGGEPGDVRRSAAGSACLPGAALHRHRRPGVTGGVTVTLSLATPLCDLLGIDVPIVQAPIGSATCPELAAAVSAAVRPWDARPHLDGAGCDAPTGSVAPGADRPPIRRQPRPRLGSPRADRGLRPRGRPGHLHLLG